MKNNAWTRIIIRRLKFQFDRELLETIYMSFIQPNIEYADVIRDNFTQYKKTELNITQHEAARIVTGCTNLFIFTNLVPTMGGSLLKDVDSNIIFFKKKKVNNSILYFLSLTGNPNMPIVQKANLPYTELTQTFEVFFR